MFIKLEVYIFVALINEYILAMAERFKILGTTDSIDCCDRCGKQRLKMTYAIQTDTGELYHLGSSCIKKAYQMTQKEFTAKVKADEAEKIRLANEEWKKTEAYEFLANYWHSGLHSEDIHERGFGYVMERTEPFRKEKKLFAERLGVPEYRLSECKIKAR